MRALRYDAYAGPVRPVELPEPSCPDDGVVVEVEATDGPGALLAPYDPIAGPVLLALLGGLVVLGLILVEARSQPRPDAG